MKIQWLGHSSFLIETNGIKILTDPFNNSIGYTTIFPAVDIVLVSHEHFDHNAVENVPSYTQVLRGSVEKELEGIKIKGIAGYHDNQKGSLRGKITMFKVQSEDISLLHLGDLGTLLTDEQLKEIGEVNIVMVPVGGKYTIGPEEAWEVIKQLNPKIVIPMHYNTPFLTLDILPLDNFLEGKPYEEKDVLEITSSTLPGALQIITFPYPK
ncbi:MAG: MBL fold metallo-hydrolase [Caldisericaceae bacterium]|nr:MBL fold metallo-hydrolase [Caldisericaceae bacterium]